MMFRFNPYINRLIVYTLVIGGSFYFGTLVYIAYPDNDREIVSVSIKKFKPQLEKAGQKDLLIRADNQLLTIKGADLKKWVEVYVRDYTGEEDLRVSSAQISLYLESLAARLNTEPVNAKLTFKNNRAQIFVPPSKGRVLAIQESSMILTDAILENQASASLVFETKDPEITLDKINDLGINTMLGRGESDYGKSSAARIHN